MCHYLHKKLTCSLQNSKAVLTIYKKNVRLRLYYIYCIYVSFRMKYGFLTNCWRSGPYDVDIMYNIPILIFTE